MLGRQQNYSNILLLLHKCIYLGSCNVNGKLKPLVMNWINWHVWSTIFKSKSEMITDRRIHAHASINIHKTSWSVFASFCFFVPNWNFQLHHFCHVTPVYDSRHEIAFSLIRYFPHLLGNNFCEWIHCTVYIICILFDDIVLHLVSSILSYLILKHTFNANTRYPIDTRSAQSVRCLALKFDWWYRL